jgi:ribonuclease P/MRP protein subunit RPP40
MLSQIIKFLDNNKLLTPYQFGFRKNYSTTSAILQLTCNILNSFEQNEFYHTYLLDLTKAFDCVSHELLIKKLLLYNFHPASTKFILTFLSDRTQIVRTNGSYSVEKKIIHGVSQGSILGPIIFLIFINDLPGYISNKNVTMYADDTTVSNKAKSLTELLTNQKNLLTH